MLEVIPCDDNSSRLRREEFSLCSYQQEYAYLRERRACTLSIIKMYLKQFYFHSLIHLFLLEDVFVCVHVHAHMCACMSAIEHV